ncbi:MAG: GNAT family N-acetyltransferase [Anaerolineae bacterium]|nr:GNAT family N-acetyltransferase [Anaerolineae bacterium]
MEIRLVGDLREIADWKQAYLDALVEPLDGYWETAVIGLAPHYKMRVAGEWVGYFAAKNGRLLQFFVTEPFLPQAPLLFAEMLAVMELDYASVSTIEPAFLSLCLDRQTAVSINTYLFQDHHPVQLTLPAFPNAQFRPGTGTDLVQLVKFYRENNENEDTEAIEAGVGGHEPYARELIENGQVFLCVDENEILGIGEYRLSKSQKSCADIGMITNNRYRRQGIGAFVLAQLKDYCYSQQVKPICSCAFDNMASRKTIEKAGFITRHRILDIQFH